MTSRLICSSHDLARNRPAHERERVDSDRFAGLGYFRSFKAE